MHDPSDIPHSKVRTALFWVLFASWPVYFLAFWIWYEAPGPVPAELFLSTGTALAAANTSAYLLGYFMFQQTQREQSWRLARVEKRVRGAESVAPFFGEDGMVRAPSGAPRLRAVRDDSDEASPSPVRPAPCE